MFIAFSLSFFIKDIHLDDTINIIQHNPFPGFKKKWMKLYVQHVFFFKSVDIFFILLSNLTNYYLKNIHLVEVAQCSTTRI